MIGRHASLWFAAAAACILLWFCEPESRAYAGMLCSSDCYVSTTGDDSTGSGTSPMDAFQTIQKALDTVADGGTVHVAAGTYSPAQLSRDIEVTLLGAQAGNDARGRVAAESIISVNFIGLFITAMSARVTVDGFKFEQAMSGSSAISPSALVTYSNAALTIENTIFSNHSTSISGRPNISVTVSTCHFTGGGAGIAATSNGSTATLSVTENQFDNLSSTAIGGQQWIDAEVTDNDLNAISAGMFDFSDPIFFNGCTDCRIERNSIADSGGSESIGIVGAAIPGSNNIVADNIISNPTMFNYNAIWVSLSTGTTVSGNTITGARDAAIEVNMNTPGTMITGNTISGANGSGIRVASAVMIADNEITGSGVGINLSSGSGGSTVSQNTIMSSTISGVSVAAGAFSADTHINRNAITGNTAGLTSATASPIDATCNWWGDASGPSGSGPGSGDSVSANVTFNPWLLGSDLAAMCGGAVNTPTITPTLTPSITPSITPTTTPTATPTQTPTQHDVVLMPAVGRPDGVACLPATLVTSGHASVTHTLAWDFDRFSLDDAFINPAIGPDSPADKEVTIMFGDPGLASFTVAGMTMAPIPTGLIYTAHFDIASDVLPGTYPLSGASGAAIQVSLCTGDCNGDGSVELSEVQHCAYLFLGRSTCSAADPSRNCPIADIDFNHRVDLGEVQECVNRFVGACP